MIIVTPYLVRPVSGRIAMPTDGLALPTDKDLYVNGRTSRQAEASGGASPVGPQGQGLIGPAGFTLN